MNKFGERSQAQLSTCDTRLQVLARKVLASKDHSIIQGHRGQAEQDAAFASGNSKLKWPDGKHNKLPSVAMDVQTYPRPADVTFTFNPDLMSLSELRQEVKSLRTRLRQQPLREDQIYLLGIYRGVALEAGIPLRTGADWDQDGELADNGFDDLFHVETT